MKSQAITACAFIYNSEKRLFLPKRAATKKFLPNKFELPGGHIEFGETIEEGLSREIQEEFNMKIILGRPFHAFSYLSNGDSVHNIEVDYFATLKNPHQEITLNPEDHSEYRWVTEEEVKTLMDPADQELLAILTGFQQLKTL